MEGLLELFEEILKGYPKSKDFDGGKSFEHIMFSDELDISSKSRFKMSELISYKNSKIKMMVICLNNIDILKIKVYSQMKG